MRHIVTLHSPDGSIVESIAVTVNRHGQLPALIVDPRDSNGQAMPGMWLGEPQDRLIDGTRYNRLVERS